MLAQRKPWRPASHDNLGCCVTTPVDEFESNGYELHAVSGKVCEWYSERTRSSFQLRTSVRTKAANFSIRKVRG